MRAEIDNLLNANGGVCSRAELLAVLSRNQVDDEIRRGHLVRLARTAYARPWDADLNSVRELAALKSVDGLGVLSHASALRRWALPAPADDTAIHLTVPFGCGARSSPDLVVHRTRGPIAATFMNGARVMPAAWALATTWPGHRGLDGAAQRAPTIRAVQHRIVTAAAIRDVVGRLPMLRGRRELIALLELVEAGCHSELELWGYTKVFDYPGLRGATRQRPVVVRGKTYYLDLAYEHARLAIELDGRAYHASADRWERDIARDLALATDGWQTLRLSHHRLNREVPGCRRDVLMVLAKRSGVCN